MRVQLLNLRGVPDLSRTTRIRDRSGTDPGQIRDDQQVKPRLNPLCGTTRPRLSFILGLTCGTTRDDPAQVDRGQHSSQCLGLNLRDDPGRPGPSQALTWA